MPATRRPRRRRYAVKRRRTRSRRPVIRKTRGRKITRSRLRRRTRSRRPSLRSFKNKVMKAVTPIQSFVATSMDRWVVVSNTLSPPWDWFGGTTRDATDANDLIYNASTLAMPNLQRIAANINTSEGGPATGRLTLRFSVVTTMMEHIVTNNSNAPANLELFYCVCRKDIPNFGQQYSWLTSLQHGLRGNAGQDIAALWNSVTPFNSSTFCTQFRVYKTKKVTLQSGKFRRFAVSSKRPKYLNTAAWFANNEQAVDTFLETPYYAWLRGAKFIVFKITGIPANTSALNGRQLVMTEPALDVLTNFKMSYRYIEPTRPNLFEGYNRGYTFTGNVPIIATDTVVTPFVNAE